MSVKKDGFLYITATGTRLGEVTDDDIACIPVEQVLKIISEIKGLRFFDKIRRVAEFSSRFSPRPSSEVFFHALLPGRTIVHTHHIGALRRQKQWPEITLRHGAVIVPYASIGIELALTISSLDSMDTPLMLLRNHGVLIQGTDPSDVLDRFDALDSMFGAGALNLPELVPHPEGLALSLPYDREELRHILASPMIGDYVFSCGPAPADDASEASVTRFRDRWGIFPSLALGDGGQVMILDKNRARAQERAEVLAAHLAMWGHTPPLNLRQVRTLVEMVRIFTAKQYD